MKRSILSALVLGLFVSVAPGAFAEGKWVTTGSSLRVKSIGPFTAKVYTITHMMKERPREGSRKGMIEAEVDKQFLLFFQRDVDADKIKNAFREGFKMNGYGDTAKIEQFVGAVGKGDVVEYDKDKKGPPSISVVYNAKAQATTINVPGHGTATIGGVDFMKAAWSLWFGKIDQPAMGDHLMATLPKE